MSPKSKEKIEQGLMSNIELIDGYLKGALNKKQKDLFDTSLENDPNFAKEFREIKEIHDGIKTVARLEALKTIENVEEELKSKESTLNTFKMKKSVIAAASLILIAAFSFFTLTKSDSNPTLQSVFQENYEPYDNIYGIVRGADDEDISLNAKAFKAYDLGDFDLAASTFSEVVKTEQTAVNYLYMGLSNLEASNIDEAIKNLNATLNNFDEFDSQAQWYLALAHLSNGDEDAALSNLVSLTLENSIYKAKAESVLAEMGLSVDSLDGGIVTDVKLRPKEDDAPEGTVFDSRRRVQFGSIVSESNGYNYRFLTDQPIYTLHVGSAVEVIVIRKNHKRRSGFVFILGER